MKLSYYQCFGLYVNKNNDKNNSMKIVVNIIAKIPIFKLADYTARSRKPYCSQCRAIRNRENAI